MMKMVEPRKGKSQFCKFGLEKFRGGGRELTLRREARLLPVRVKDFAAPDSSV